MRSQRLIVVALFVAALGADASAQVLMRPGGNGSGITIIEPTFTPPYRLTVSVYVTAQDGRPVPPPLGANVLVIDPQGRRAGMDAAGVLHSEIPGARWDPVRNPAPQEPVGPRGLAGTSVTLDDPPDGPYVIEVAGTDRVLVDLGVAQWDHAGHRRWLHFLRASTEPGAVDRWDMPYTGAARPAFDLHERRDDSYLSVRTYGRDGDAFVAAITELLLTDPRGRRLGYDAKSRQTVQEIPRASYDSGTGDIDARELELTRLTDGDYTLDVIGLAPGRYTLGAYLSDRAGHARGTLDVAGVETQAGQTHRYRLEVATPPRLTGFLGHDARLLSYAAPTTARAELPPGATTATIVIVYGPTITHDSFRATLDGRDVTARFKPAPGVPEAVALPVAPGSNTLVLSVRGAGPHGKTIVHTDQFEFVRR